MKKKLTRSDRRSRRLGLEKLESRRVLAGNVQASVRGGNLNLIGDSSNNEITITYAANAFTVASRDSSTTINGQAGPLTFTRVKKDVNIAMGSGADVVEFDGGSDPNAAIWIRKRLNIDMGSGADQVLMTNVHMLRLQLNLGTGDDTLNIGNNGSDPGILVTKEANIIAIGGQDDVSIANSQFKKFVNVDLGNNNDTLTIQNTSVRKRSNFNGGPGLDTLNRENNTGKMRFFNFEQINETVTSPAPLPPVANNDTASVVRNSSTSINVAANDTAPGSTINNASITITQAPTHGTAVANSNGTVTYTNNGDSATTDSFLYTIKNADGTTSNAATVSITVTNSTLQANNDAASVTEDTGPNPVTGNVTTNDTHATGTTLTVTEVKGSAANVGTGVLGNNSFGTFTINANGSFTYQLDNNNATINALTDGQTQTDTITYKVSDGTQTSTATVTITITGRTDLSAAADAASVTEDTGPNPVTGNVTTNDTHATGTTLTVTEVKGSAANVGTGVLGDNSFGTFTINANGSFTYQLDNNNATINALTSGQTQTDTITYKVSDGTQTSTATVTITITGRTDLSAAADAASVTEDTGPNPVTGNVTTNDTHATGTTLTVTEVKGSAANVGTGVLGDNSFGTFTINANGSFTYQLDNNNATINALTDGQTQTDTITYKVSDGTQTSTATVTITITGRTDLSAAPDSANITEDASPDTTSGNVLTNDTHATGTTLTVTEVKGSAANVGTGVLGDNSFGTFTINANGSFTYQLDNNNATINALTNGQTQTDTITYKVSDGTQTSTTTLTVTINGHTELDAVNDTGFSVTEDSATDTTTGNVIDNDTGGNGTKSVSAVKGLATNVGTDVPGTHGTFHIAANGAFTYTLNNADTDVNNLNDGQTLTDSMDYTLTDGIATDTATLSITIQGHTDP